MTRDPVEAAADRVGWSEWSLDPSGSPLPQSIPRELVTDMIRMLAAAPGASILEIGTGCGYSTAVLAHVVTGSGAVTSIDIDPEVVARVRPLIGAAGLHWVQLVCTDGWRGHAPRAPYDGIISWAAVSQPPAGWRAQLVPQGIAVVPLLGPPALIRRFRNGGRGFIPETAIRGEFVRLSGEGAGHGRAGDP